MGEVASPIPTRKYFLTTLGISSRTGKPLEMQLCPHPHPTIFAVLLEGYKVSSFDTRILRALGKTLPGNY